METARITGTTGTTYATETTQQLHNQLFDKCLKFLLQRLSSKPLIMSINGLFGEHYPLDSNISRMDKEFITSGMGKILTDSLLLVDSKPYLIEVQIQNNSEMVIRMVEYGLASARSFKEEIDDILTLYFPREVVIYLESNSNTSAVERVRLVFPDGSEHLYTLPTLRLPELSLDEIEAKGLFILLPFEVLRLRKAVVAAKTSERKAELAAELKRIIDKLLAFFEQQHQAGVLTIADWNELVVVIDKLNAVLYKEEPEFKEVLNMFDDWDNDPRIIAAKKIDAAEAKARESEQRWQESERQRQEGEPQRQALELKLQEYERRDFR
jgi:hypothetical protein